jgi:uncharacterized membrane protein YGL010W
MTTGPTYTAPGHGAAVGMAPRRVDRLFAEYGRSHANPTNRLVHFVAVPMIAWSALAVAALVPLPSAIRVAPWLNASHAVAAVALVYYLALSPRIAVAMAAQAVALLWLVGLARSAPVPFPLLIAVVFVVAVVMQAVGHRIEGRRPSFLSDVQFLLVGPAWLTALVFRRLGLRY